MTDPKKADIQKRGNAQGESELTPMELRQLRTLLGIHREVVEEKLRAEFPELFQERVRRPSNRGDSNKDRGRGT